MKSCISNQSKPNSADFDYGMQAVEVKGEDGVWRSALMDSDEPLTNIYSDARTVYEIFHRGLTVSNGGPCLGSRKPNQPYEWQSYTQVFNRAQCIGSALLHNGHSQTGDKFIAIFSQNRPEFTISELACYTFSLVVVPLYNTLSNEAIKYILDKATISTVICDVPEKALMMLDSGSAKGGSVKTVVVMEAFDENLVRLGAESGINIMSFKELEELGKTNYQKPMPPKPDDLALVCFTSGTTGNPKGAKITHGNIVSDTGAYVKTTQALCPLGPDDIQMSYLPLGHIFERCVQCVTIINGGRIGFFQGDIQLLLDDIKTLRPTMIPVVPRVLTRMYDQLFRQANTPAKKQILSFAFKKKAIEIENGVVRRDSIWDKLIFKKVQDSLGGRVRMMACAAAPVSPAILTCMRAALGCHIYEIYGLTEATGGCTMTVPGDWSAGHVGHPLPCCAIKLVDVGEMNYLVVNGEGEVCAKGPNIFQGYLKDPEKTAEVIDQDGWLHTGDIGKWLPNGTLKIIDRKKHIFKLAQGEYIAPEKIETVYNRSDPVAQIFVHGESLRACLVGIVVPDPEYLPLWLKKKGIEGSYSELCSNKEVKNAILEDMIRLGKNAGLKSFEQVKDIMLHPEPFTVENGLLTPTMKGKRMEILRHFQDHIDLMYASMNP